MLLEDKSIVYVDSAMYENLRMSNWWDPHVTHRLHQLHNTWYEKESDGLGLYLSSVWLLAFSTVTSIQHISNTQQVRYKKKGGNTPLDNVMYAGHYYMLYKC